jgi:hypothetical protein
MLRPGRLLLGMPPPLGPLIALRSCPEFTSSNRFCVVGTDLSIEPLLALLMRRYHVPDHNRQFRIGHGRGFNPERDRNGHISSQFERCGS